MKQSLVSSLVLTGGVTLVLNIIALAGIHPIIRLLQTPAEIEGLMFDYLFIIFLGIASHSFIIITHTCCAHWVIQ